MKLTVLGKYGPYPKTGCACSGYLLEAGDKRVLLDCGSGVFAHLTAHCPVEGLDAVVLTHLHGDHMSDMLVLRYALQFLDTKALWGNGLPVFLPATPQNIVEELAKTPFFALDIVAGGQSRQLGGLRLGFFPVRHPVECNALRVEAEGRTFVFSGDMNTTPGFVDFARGADLLLIDALFAHADWNENLPHLSARLAAEVAREAGVGRVLLTHMLPGSDEAVRLTEAQAVFPNAQMAQEGQCYTI